MSTLRTHTYGDLKHLTIRSTNQGLAQLWYPKSFGRCSSI